jgi:hypothetical protein
VVVGSLCCLGPIALGGLGIGANLALPRLDRYRPLLHVLAIGFLGLGFFLAYRRRTAASCCTRRQRLARALLWLMVPLVGVATALPYVGRAGGTEPKKPCCPAPTAGAK